MSSEQIFFEAFGTCTTGVSVECKCGVIHFDFNHQYDSQTNDEIEQLLKAEEEFPDQYRSHDGSLRGVFISGHIYMPGCKCGGAEKYKQLIDNNALAIAEYLRGRSAQLKTLSEQISL